MYFGKRKNIGQTIKIIFNKQKVPDTNLSLDKIFYEIDRTTQIYR